MAGAKIRCSNVSEGREQVLAQASQDMPQAGAVILAVIGENLLCKLTEGDAFWPKPLEFAGDDFAQATLEDVRLARIPSIRSIRRMLGHPCGI